MNQEEFDRLTQQSLDNIRAKVICDSVNPDGVRLTTMEWKYPRFIHSEIMTHRKLSRNSASSRAIPLSKMIANIQECPVFPIHWGKNEKGMQASTELDEICRIDAGRMWIAARDKAITSAKLLEAVGIHKQIGNRLLEPWMWITVIVSATNFENLFALRCHVAAEPHFQNLAYKVRDALDASDPDKLQWGEWHLPYFGQHGGDMEDYALSIELHQKVSAGRCARVSYLTHEGKREPEKDVELCDRLSAQAPVHASPLEHPSQALNPMDYEHPLLANSAKRAGRRVGWPDWGNFDSGWLQFRKMIPNENVTKRHVEFQRMVEPS